TNVFFAVTVSERRIYELNRRLHTLTIPHSAACSKKRKRGSRIHAWQTINHHTTFVRDAIGYIYITPADPRRAVHLKLSSTGFTVLGLTKNANSINVPD
ncbi:MAG: hypothetical protein LBI90_00540, partial [Treponema sp.]|nr:hypothetical protein [Treponema sp.]